MKKYIYQEILMSNRVSFIEQLNEQGQYGWQFITQAQRVSNKTALSLDNKPVIEIVMIFKKEFSEPLTVKN